MCVLWPRERACILGKKTKLLLNLYRTRKLAIPRVKAATPALQSGAPDRPPRYSVHNLPPTAHIP